MIRLVKGLEQGAERQLLSEMFEARRRLFAEQLGWEVEIDERGWERDRFDGPSALYLISRNDEGRHVGSLRLLPTTGETMLRDAFATVNDGRALESPSIWECTRFCVEGGAAPDPAGGSLQKTTSALLLGICEVGLSAGIEQILGVFDRRFLPIYQGAGWAPEIVGEGKNGRETIFLGIWDISKRQAQSIRSAGGFDGPILEPGSRKRAKDLLRAA